MSMDKLIEVSNRYGSDADYVLAGGGNTSWKTDEFMYVKGSGTELATIDSDGFVKVDLKKLDKIWSKTYSVDTDTREEEVLADLMASRFPEEKEKRPSVETLLHGMLPYTYVVHTHPALINGITCSNKAAELVRELFGNRALWVSITNPGYILAKVVKDRIDEHLKSGGEFPVMIFLQNHGVFVSANTINEIDSLYAHMFKVINDKVSIQPDRERQGVDPSEEEKAVRIIRNVLGKDMAVLGFRNKDIMTYSRSAEAFAPLSLSFTPDHIVYYGFKPVYSRSLESLGEDLKSYRESHKETPRLAVVKNIGAFAINTSENKAAKSALLFEDNVKIAVYTKSFGGYRFMPQDKIDFIRNWEVEKYRASKS
ncbi:MAG: class II aldolase [Spirochaetales bacterium]|nr:class II aldolase [Spirochaetales bacterium]